MASSRVQIAELAGVSRQAVHKALRRGWLIAEADGRIDLKREPNASYLAHHAGGYDIRVRPMSTHRGRGSSGRPRRRSTSASSSTLLATCRSMAARPITC